MCRRSHHDPCDLDHPLVSEEALQSRRCPRRHDIATWGDEMKEDVGGGDDEDEAIRLQRDFGVGMLFWF